MKVEIWSDYMCPFCYIGKRRFEEALDQFPHKDKVEVIYRSFELDPEAARDVDYDVHTMLSKKYNMSVQEAKAMNDNITEQAKSVGLTYHFDTMVLSNSFDAHRLTHFAAQHGKMREMNEALFRAVFTDSKHIGNHDVLSDLAVSVGLERAAVAEVLGGDQFAQAARFDEQLAGRLGIRAVPFFVLNEKYGISGAQPTEAFAEQLLKAWNESAAQEGLAGSNAGDSCADGACSI
ncbi:DsbA family oxidoreductase [Paenibacillus taiwanensis]|uniref:DsbA family oxidoreductase n=1 Tax=Paenibacillus taiwanensis TaxID=401638 RepID=UPI0003F64D76|nr:DsbA family oxidoreductase [Paenibacillus taiwanensis]